MKRIEMHHHFLSEKVLHEEVLMKSIKTKDLVTDIFTKGLGFYKFTELRRHLRMNVMKLVLRGSVKG